MIDAKDREIIEALQGGLPLVSAPYAQVAKTLGLDEDALLYRLAELKSRGVIRRIAAAPNHYKLGMTSNGMTVWDVDDARITELGAQIGALPFVTHCYERPRALPDWPYNLFAMVHGSDRDEVEEKRAEIAAILGDACRAKDILYSTRILKKTGLRLKTKG
ncbi:siroheme decarboxylase subunit beta [Ruegeria atlantica]|uniref:siroheme decarboxylase subunit beta n=1 Tax=Ruegeria atlantica TaxID=81569 RepID=UPI00147DBC98|nr:AsnC family transcriptional regulator [Ruegeria atlantica]